MDGRNFDALARRFGARLTRRSTLRTLLGGAAIVATGGALSLGDDAAARCGANGVRCNRDDACCSGHCSWTVRTVGLRRMRVGACAPAPTATPTVTPSPTDTPPPTATPSPTETPSPTPTIACAAATQPCTTVADCCAGLYCDLGESGSTPGACDICIIRYHFGCAIPADCCDAGWSCSGGMCVPPN